ncbi:PREDICTED: mucin-1-like [Gavialis gangeticus]|uniref:mucin-1-like n=1 Tax=Gavialis gangeticus TaxID=94835 RepID=UPI00092F1D62|nr:PREDICTED: mucin-1-like [Gavialis gangeticus]
MPSSLHPETGGFSAKATAPPVTSRDQDAATTQLSVTGPRTLGPEEPSLPPSLRAATEAEGLQTPVTTSAPDATTGLRNESQAANSSSDIPSPPPTANATELNQPGHEGTEPTGTPGQLSARTEAPTPLTPKDSPATQGRAQPPSEFSTLGPRMGRPDSVPGTAHEGATKESNTEPATIPATQAGLATTASSTTTGASVAASAATATAISTTIRTPPAAVTRQAVDPVHEKVPVLDVGDEEDQAELPSSPVTGMAGADPLVITIISVFIIMVGILGLVGFLKYRQHNSRMEFRRLQDLPMDDMMEDTPLSLYSY